MIKERRYSINDIVESKNSKYKIIDYYIKNYEENGKKHSRFVYLCECLKDGYKFERTQNQIEKKIGCPLCTNKVVVYGYNSLADERPDLVDYFVDQELPKKIRPQSNIYTDGKCPICGYVKNICISNLYKNGFSCPNCSDGISYPNKFIRELLRQTVADYKPEMVFDWAPNYIYDDYLPYYNIIIENDGEQHLRTDAFGGYRDDNKIDRIKDSLAKENGIRLIIRLDCSESSMGYIKKSVMDSQLPIILNFREEDINWSRCEYMASSSYVKIVWDMWNNGVSAYDIMDNLKLSDTTIRDYINRGYNAGICNMKCYFKKTKWNIKGNNNNHLYNVKPFFCVEDNAYYLSSTEYINHHLDEQLCYKSITRAIKQNITYKGKHFIGITKQEFNDKKALSIKDGSINVYGELLDARFL